MLEKQTVIDQIEITRDGHIQVRKANLIIEDDKEIAKTYHRHVLSPGDNLTNEDDKVKNIANVVWTQEVIDTYKAKLIENKI